MKNIGVFFGGKSPEHDISIITAELIISGLKNLPFRITPVYINKEGHWFLGDKLGSIEFFRKKNQFDHSLEKYLLDMNGEEGKITLKRKGLISKKVVLDIAFPAFHGQNGEDGTIQGLFEILDVPYVGCNVSSSSLTMDKVLTKLFYQQLELPTTKFISFLQEDWDNDQKMLIEKIDHTLAWPLFIKPARLGSSIGIAKARNKQELTEAIEVSLHYDEKCIVEEAVEPVMDITCAILGNTERTASLLQESNFAQDFFSYEDKYLNDGGAQLGKAKDNIIIPARIDKETTKTIQNYAKNVFKSFGCSGIARIDFLYNPETKKIFVNEVNTLPGTLYHHLWKKSGIELPKLLEMLITLAEEKYRNRKKITRTFTSSVLEQADWSKKLKKEKEI